jgi:hypothetical protein
MGENGDKTRHQQAEEKVLQMRGFGVMRRLDQHVARVAEREQPSGLKARNKIRHDVIVRAGNELEGNAFLIEGRLQLAERTPDLRTAIVVQAG